MKRCSIIIPVWNELEFTRRCIDSIIKYTRLPYRLIVIDNGSDAPLADYLNDLKKRLNFVLIKNEDNLGFVKAVNQGIDAAGEGDLILLNNDTVVTEGWLEEILNIADEDASIGIINPSSNSLGQYPEKISIDEYAKSLNQEHGKWQELDTAQGFCMFIKREVINQLHHFDEKYGIGYLEETDFCKRAQLIGYKNVRAKAAYVYHESGVTFKKIPHYRKLYEENLKLFYQKWDKPLRIVCLINRFNTAAERETMYNISIAAARVGHKVLIFLHPKAKNFIIPDHASIRAIYIHTFFRFNCFFKIFERKFKAKDEKQIDIVFLNDEGVYKVIKFFQNFLSINILNKPTLANAQELYKSRSNLQHRNSS